MLTNLLATTAMKVAAAIIAALVLALGICWIGWTSDANRADRNAEKLALSEANHAVTAASYESLSKQMEAMVSAGEMRAERLNDAMAQAQDDADGALDEAERLRAEGVRVECTTSDSIMGSGRI